MITLKTKSKQVSHKQQKFVLIEPFSDIEVTEALESLRERNFVITNLEHLSSAQQRRVADCLTGFTCAIDGQTRWLGNHTLLCAPAGSEVTLD